MAKSMIFRTHESDAVVTTALNRLKNKYQGQVVTVSGGLGPMATLRHGDCLAILGHGSPRSLGGYTATQLAGVLANADLHSGVDIDLVACNCGATGAPYAMDLKMELVNKKILPGRVTAGTSYMWVKPDGTPFSKQKGGPEITSGKQTVMTPWGARTRNIRPIYRAH